MATTPAKIAEYATRLTTHLTGQTDRHVLAEGNAILTRLQASQDPLEEDNGDMIAFLAPRGIMLQSDMT